ncbi:MAG: hypothetical protein JSW03_08405 [Candidatus Eiseniibacteriota bacterium]|nr:MAG: hypothetical protein JSW03_08405 [Candidatus Eisenbacteria bacterium]
MKAAYVGVILSTLVLAGCLHEDSTPEYLTSWASADSVEVLSVEGLSVEFEVFGAKPTPCHEVIDPAVTEEVPERRVTVQMRSRIRRDTICIQVIASHRTTIVVTVSAPGAWEFEFRDSFGDEPIVIGVNVPG